MRRHLVGILVALFVSVVARDLRGTEPLPPAACSQQPGGPPPCTDSDGDGLCDAWELAGRLPSGARLVDSDPHRPDIYLQYDYMGWGTPGARCHHDSDCTAAGATPNLVCHQGRCNHTHKPDEDALQIVIDSFARHGVALHIDPHPREIPHSEVITFARAGDPDWGPTAACAGADVQPGVLGGPVVSFADVKASFFDSARLPAYHYAVFSHFTTCLQDADPSAVGYCGACPNDRATPPGRPTAGMSGTSELPGNDFIIALGSRELVANVPREVITEAGVFMHELGHNLGLHHDGDNANHELAPNYLSVMNNLYVFDGLEEATAVGSTWAKTCTAATDCQLGDICYRSATLPSGLPGECRRVDYSSSKLKTISELTLDEPAGLSPLSTGLRDIVSFWDYSGSNGLGPASGPIDWDGLPGVSCLADADCAGGGSLTGRCLDDGSCAVQVDLNLNGIMETFVGFNDWDHGTCATEADCPVNGIRQIIHITLDPSVDPHEPCVQGRCGTLWYGFACTQWGGAD
jgi:hypothetical protein